jgi:hypothetical protein
MKIAVFWVVAPCSLVEVYQPRRQQSSIEFNILLTYTDKSIKYDVVNTYNVTKVKNPISGVADTRQHVQA